MFDIVLMDGQVIKDCELDTDNDVFLTVFVPACGCGTLRLSKSLIRHIVER